jgi:hypothetical protein
VRGVALGGRRGDLGRMKEVSRKGNRASVAARSLQAAKRNEDLRPVIEDIGSCGATSLHEIADELNKRGTAHAVQGDLLSRSPST